MISQFIHIYLIKLPPFVVKIKKLVVNLKGCFLNVVYIKCIYQNYSQLILVKVVHTLTLVGKDQNIGLVPAINKNVEQ